MSLTTKSTTADHEQLEVIPQGPAKKIMRQERFELVDAQCVLRISGRDYPIRNYSTFGIAVASPTPVLGLESSVPASVLIDGRVMAKLQVRRVHETRVASEGYTLGLAIEGDPLSISRLRGTLLARKLVTDHRATYTERAPLPVEFVHLVYELKDSLERLEERIDELQASTGFNARDEGDDFEAGIADVVAGYVRAMVDPIYEELAGYLDGLQGTDLKLAYEFFRSKLRHLLHQSPLAQRIYEKPLGYAGDHEMMTFIYNDQNAGNSLFAKCLHRYYIEHPNARAVRNRATYLRDKLLGAIGAWKGERRMRVLSVACGPAFEVQQLVERGVDLSQVEFVLLDQDLSALRSAQRGISTAMRAGQNTVEVKYAHKAIRNILKEGLDGEYDLIYSAGLFDYFSDALAKHVATRFMRALAPAGSAVIGNFTAAARSRALMELALDWHLTYRSDADLRSLYGGVGSSLEIEAEPEGINLFVVLQK